ncbi:Mitochondrial import inner membrane translocase subunit TIM50 [Forsythia ovata]|uniref:Mitochondrial import inner membrane translocase subunit TIM50 n=1 Tax=Forsythia ovata TaxID=205694 RepID=A0ABD1S5G6_9LAMI
MASVAALTGGAATAGYATYAYSLDEIDHKTKVFRAPANYTIGDEASSFDKFQAYVSTSAVTVPAKLVDLYIDLRRLTEEQVRGFTEPISEKLLPDLHPLEQHVFTLVLDLNETLIHSDWKRDRGWRTFKRPGVDAFLEHLAQFYEIIVYSDQLNMDLSMLNRDPKKVLYISAHGLESSLQSDNCVSIKPWQGEAEDTALLDLIPFLEYVAKHRPADVRTVLASYQGLDISKEFIERSKEYQRRMQDQKQHGRLWRR